VRYPAKLKQHIEVIDSETWVGLAGLNDELTGSKPQPPFDKRPSD